VSDTRNERKVLAMKTSDNVVPRHLRDPRWVTKSDLRQYWLCPYAFWLMDSGLVNLRAILATRKGFADRVRIASGELFEKEILDEMPVLPIGVAPEDAGVQFLYGIPTYEHDQLMLRGRPDGIEVATLAPMEIKSHSAPSALDRLELAFYWMLLGVDRKNVGLDPYGWLIPRDQGVVVSLIRVDLRANDFRYVEEMIAAVRKARSHGVKPRLCACVVCATRSEVLKIKRSGRHVTLVSGIGRRHGMTLDLLNVSTVNQLITVEPEDLARRIREAGRARVSIKNITAWQHHSRAFLERKPIRFVEEQFSSPSYFVLDFEYDRYGRGAIWLIGALMRRDGRDMTFQFWCDTPTQLRRGLQRLDSLLRSSPDIPVVTFSGLKADLPQLRIAAKSLGLDIMTALAGRHVDIYDHVMKSMRFPIANHGLKELSKYIRSVRRAKVADGDEAIYLYERYTRSKSDRVRASIKKQLTVYNLDDLSCVADLIDFIRKVPLHSQASVANILAHQEADNKKRPRRKTTFGPY
jgi:predicted RecB family nuclease